MQQWEICIPHPYTQSDERPSVLAYRHPEQTKTLYV